MQKLSSRERLARLFAGKELDRVPIWLLSPYHRLACYADIYNNPQYAEIVKKIVTSCDIFDRRTYEKGVCYNANPEIKSEYKELKDGNGIIQLSSITYKDFRLEKFISRGNGRTEVKYFIDDFDDLERLLEIPYVPPVPDISQYEKEKQELGDKGLMMIDIGDSLCPLYHLMSAEDFAVSSLTEYDRMLQCLDVIHERVLGLYRYFLERDIGDVFFIVGAEFAGPPLVSPDKFNALSARYVKSIVDLIRSYGEKIHTALSWTAL